MKELKRSAGDFERLCGYWEDNECNVPETAREYYEIYQKFQTGYMLMLTKWNIAYNEMFLADTAEDTVKKGIEAQDCIRRILSERKILENGCWQGWLSGEKKLNFEGLLEKTREKSAELAAMRA